MDKIKWKKGRAIIEVEATVRIPIVLEAVTLATWVSQVNLSPREKLVLAAVLSGLSNKEIGNQMNIGESAVKHHMQNLLRKFRVQGRGPLMALFAGRREE
jgi:DNA-binding NarL/FixJ family response regulator